MKFSILIANYNNGKYFKDCYHSIIAQTYDDWEAIIVDDRSTDDSILLIKRLIKSDTRFKLYENDENKGCGFTKRRCAQMATGEICGFLDPDDTITDDALTLMILTHQQNSDVSVVHSSFFYCDKDLKRISPFQFARPVIIDEKFINMDGGVTAFATFKTKAYKTTAGIHPSLQRAVDQDLYLRLSEMGPFFFLNKFLYNYRIHDNGIASSNSMKAFYNHLKVIIWAEQRRGINLENEVEPHLRGKGKPAVFYEIKLSNSRFIIRRVFGLLKRNPVGFIKGLFLKSHVILW